uniref:YagK/YfjJ domain-containing protein n=1 Tax=Atlantibacter hermannii TaxID=565 RepID=UPI002072D193
IRCPRQNMKTSIINGSEVSKLSVAIQDDYPGLVHYPENCRYILDVNDFNFEGEYNKLLNRFDYLAKLDTKAYGDGDRSFGCSRG